MKYLIMILSVLLLSIVASAQVETQFRTDYELVAAGQTTQVIGPVGAKGDILDRVIIIPETTGAGTVSIKDGSNTAINIFVAGTLPSLAPMTVVIGSRSTSGAWQITTGTNVHVIAVGKFK